MSGGCRVLLFHLHRHNHSMSSWDQWNHTSNFVPVHLIFNTASWLTLAAHWCTFHPQLIQVRNTSKKRAQAWGSGTCLSWRALGNWAATSVPLLPLLPYLFRLNTQEQELVSPPVLYQLVNQVFSPPGVSAALGYTRKGLGVLTEPVQLTQTPKKYLPSPQLPAFYSQAPWNTKTWVNHLIGLFHLIN